MPATSETGYTGRRAATTTPQKLRDTNSSLDPASEGIQLLAASINTDVVYIGYSSGITAGTNGLTDGFPLYVGAGLFIPHRRVDEIWVLANSSVQTIWYLTH
jgi:hypothetical protein